MVDRYSSVSQALSENPYVADILMSYGIPCHGHMENQLSSLEDVAIRYGVDVEAMINQVNSNNNSLF